ncbi:ABC transporter permease [Lachnospiraceae bacterium OttesenSCG-928-D06]|nr:ABC transporter permease [Lachnospiraceae bacterium OttesenSCG-928-D06]
MNVFFLEFRNNRKNTLIWMLSIGFAIFAMLAFFPSMQTEGMQSLANTKLEGVDPALLAAFGLDIMPDFTVITDFFGYILQFIVLAIMVYVTQGAASLLIKEETDGTIEYLYGKPVSRNEIFFQKLLAIVLLFLIMLTIFASITILGYLIFSDYIFYDAFKESMIFYSAILFVGLVFVSIGTLLSTLIRSEKTASGVTISIVFGTFVLGMLSSMVEKLDFLIYFSPMSWIKTQKLMSDGITLYEWIIGIVLIVSSIWIACLKYRRKDLLI